MQTAATTVRRSIRSLRTLLVEIYPENLHTEGLQSALTDLSSISERRVENLVNPDLSGLPGFLTPHPGLNSGMMLVQVLAAANYMGGVASSQRKQFERADAMLRAALPQLKENEEIEATALYHLGFANYKLAERGAENRAQDALKYMRLCGELKSAYQVQAIKNVDAIRAEYNLQ